MNLKNKLKWVAAIVAAFSFAVVGGQNAKASTIDNSYALNSSQGSSLRTNNNVVIAHATAVYAPARNVAAYEKREWYNAGAYVQYIVGDGGKIYRVGAEGYQAWGAGSWANANAPVQVELAQTYNQAEFRKDYVAYVNLLHSSAVKYGIPTDVDSSAWRGVKSHLWVTNNVWGDHTDPYGYLASHGITKAQFAHDVQYGFSSSGNDVSPAPKPTPKPVKPANKKQVDITYALHQRGGSWYPDVKNFGSGTNGYAGAPYLANDLLYIKVNRGSIKYRVHTIEDGWLPWVTKANKNDTVNGVAGIKGHTIDGVQMYYTTPSGETYQQAYYRSQTTQRAGYLGTCADNGTVAGYDSWAGMYGEPLDRLQISINDHSNF
ncbi:peptidoglycan recognition family protein [Pediococcus acidilactici]|uniref:peptidoglycan recognition protein family protein n=1 Tax=Pediococcus acidilactici TaxID=1254 RepID=UPI0003271353|nr:peptidoglycan recognition family protein [Pediococcus acidilactici]EOA09447.1 N-acetylmuramoyl-L-alanine amidase [Pediococcus acidilactici D3]MBW4796924.1 N-acetylmuramoyl-L-alanine amidase [Pediococcus acidilactici]MBW9306176.1 N-acetylmuramoyl-L-alanine amidase [Pediococcus acidilactici]MCE5961402.1 peptidoglycan recognition protein family protein [Pediococcus acidilactici]MCW8082331.1 peptidoglycan recognition protein family protein [Pediococcus acidilactici]